MSAAARAEARRKAILSRGSDRLAKLTTSARGEDAPAHLHDDPPLPNISTGLRNFVGEKSTLPTPPKPMSPSPSPRPVRTSATNSSDAAVAFGSGSDIIPDPSVWSWQQQQQFVQVLIGGSSLSQPESLPPSDVGPTLPPADNPFAAMLAPKQGHAFSAGAGDSPATRFAVKRPTRLQKLMPFVHLVTMWCLLAYFMLYRDTQVHEAMEPVSAEGAGTRRRWAQLGRNSPTVDVAQIYRVQAVPFFWAFTTLQIVLHSVRIFSGFDAVQPPTLLALALPHLPAPFPSIIMNALKYMQMGSLFLDDLAGLVVGIGFIVLCSGWFAA